MPMEPGDGGAAIDFHRRFDHPASWRPAVTIQLIDEGHDGRVANRHTSMSLMVRSSTPLAQSMTIRAESTAVNVR